MTNFDHFLSDPQFAPFAEVAVSAEKIYPIDPAACVLNCRRGMESEQRRRLSGRAMGYAV